MIVKYAYKFTIKNFNYVNTSAVPNRIFLYMLFISSLFEQYITIIAVCACFIIIIRTAFGPNLAFPNKKYTTKINKYLSINTMHRIVMPALRITILNLH